MDEFDQIVGDMQAEQEKPGRVALVLIFDELPGTTMFDLNELAKGTYRSMKDLPSYVNLTVTVTVNETADQIEKIVQEGLDS